jgi:hypothetical protein
MESHTILTLALLTAILIISIITLTKVKKPQKDNYRSQRANIQSLRDMGPTAGGSRVTPPPGFTDACLGLFSQGCDQYGNIVGNDSGQVKCIGYTEPDEMPPYGTTVVAYQPSDCDNPLQWQQGYLCQGGSGDPSSNPCPSGGTVIGDAPENPYGCTNICQ